LDREISFQCSCDSARPSVAQAPERKAGPAVNNLGSGEKVAHSGDDLYLCFGPFSSAVFRAEVTATIPAIAAELRAQPLVAVTANRPAIAVRARRERYPQTGAEFWHSRAIPLHR